MDVRSQISMVFHLDKCIGCHTCSIACKNVWTDRKGTEYMWWNNVETKPGTGYPTQVGGPGEVPGRLGGERASCACVHRKQAAGRLQHLPQPAHAEHGRLLRAVDLRLRGPVQRARGPDQPTAGRSRWSPASRSTSRRAPTGTTTSAARRSTPRTIPTWRADSRGQRQQLFAVERLVFFYLPRICNHCLNPACVAACPSGALYKRGEDGIVLIDQKRCRAWRACVAACPYKKTYYNWSRASRRSASSASRAWRPGRRRPASTRASGASATWACCSTTPTGSRRWPSAGRRADRGPALADPRPVRSRR
jgi:nitrate reductase / nitrite oxidoreductase, beta subunit